MKKNHCFGLSTFLLIFIALFIIFPNQLQGQDKNPQLRFEISAPHLQSHSFQVDFFIGGINKDSLILKMPKWMPGYYQIMNYAENITKILAINENGDKIPVQQINGNTWLLRNIRNQKLKVHYEIKTSQKFVALSYIDSTHAYYSPAGTFLYLEGFLKNPVSVKIIPVPGWNKIATGLEEVSGTLNEFTAPDFDVLFDCPILTGDLEELPSFSVNGVNHRFIGYEMGTFDKTLFIEKLKKVVESAVTLMDDIPYKNYTFIAIGPGRGGIEHLNSTTISFDGNSLSLPDGMDKMMSFIGHEYFHNFNVKRIRPFELGPFDYDRENRTNLLWVSEGLTVYYEYMILKWAGLFDENNLFRSFEKNLNAVENDPGRFYQSLSQSSYYTWEDGPFGDMGAEDKSISYYDKGPVIGLLLDFVIRYESNNQKSLDDVMRFLYHHYYQNLQRGFTDAEFQQTCESIAGASVAELFEYVNTTKEPDYNKYLGYAGLKIENEPVNLSETQNRLSFRIIQLENPNVSQTAILKSWLAE